MQIEIPQNEHQRLSQQAAEAGYTDVQLYVTEHVLALAHQPSTDEMSPLSPRDLEASLVRIDRSMAEFEAGGGLSIEEARQLSLEQLRQLEK